jgi:Actin
MATTMDDDDDPLTLVVDCDVPRVRVGEAGEDDPRYFAEIGFPKGEPGVGEEGHGLDQRVNGGRVWMPSEPAADEGFLGALGGGSASGFASAVLECCYGFLEQQKARKGESRYSGGNFGLLLAEPLGGRPESRWALVEQLFEQEPELRDICLASRALLALMASGRTMGTVVDTTAHRTVVASLRSKADENEKSEGEEDLPRISWMPTMLSPSVREVSVGGAHMLAQLGGGATQDLDNFVARYANRLDCRVDNFTPNSTQGYDDHFVLPGGRVLKDARAAETLFQPSLAFPGATRGLASVVCDSVRSASPDKETQKDLFQNICVAGWPSFQDGFADRLGHELKACAKDEFGCEPKVVCPPERRHSVWIGGSILASLSTRDAYTVTRAEIEEGGSGAFFAKCPTLDVGGAVSDPFDFGGSGASIKPARRN